jgi:eukaryotic-like serine/threonine-protein kinase
VSHEGEARDATPGTPTPSVMTFGAPTQGELIADRYRLEQHIDTDAAGRQIWRGIDTVLRRPVAVVVRQPGGEAANGMLTAAVAASRLVHPHLVSVYDAIDEQHRAYLVREWVPGVALRDILKHGPLDAERATLVTHAIAEAVAALHAAGIVHGNVHPGTILIADDGRVVLADAHADGPADAASDTRALGAVLYACLTSHWPYAEAGHSTLPDAVRDNAGRLASLRQVRGGIPRHLDEIASELLDRRSAPPAAATVAAEFARLATQGNDDEPDYEDEAGPMGFGGGEVSGTRRRAGGKLALGVGVLTVIAVAGAFFGVKVLGANPQPQPSTPGAQTTAPSPTATSGTGKPIAISASQVRIVDPPRGNRAELGDANLTVDGDLATGWATDTYNQPYFGGSKPGGGIKPGMGVLIDLGTVTQVGAVKVVVSQQGATVALRSGTSDPGSSTDGDKAINTTFTAVGQPFENHPGTVMVFPVPEEQRQMRYLMVWVTKLPSDNKGRFSLSINEITVLAP